ncbi:hypothetical protein ECANGB1_1447 [Enterospora canceri]|uniref:U3 small nucleolar RNA-associated protein 15 C-terminal domain-containing protein n=1 Tax=Enterospora canceri TaxID=1081671 RepID=A0A1Y1S633_9MICR|nr:hypothetical protein ECANGB1_1447 [Enterospora canceri]
MNFDDVNYKLPEFNRIQFEKTIEVDGSICNTYCTDKMIVYATETTVYAYDGKKNSKIYNSTIKITTIYAHDDVIYIGFNTNETLFITLSKTVIGKCEMNDAIIAFKKVQDCLLILTPNCIHIYDLKTNRILKEFRLFINLIGIEEYDGRLYVLDKNKIKQIEINNLEMKIIEEKYKFRTKMMSGFRMIKNGCIGFGETRIYVITENGKVDKISHYKSITDILICCNSIYTASKDHHIKAFDFNLKRCSSVNIREPAQNIAFIRDDLYVIGQSGIYIKKKKVPLKIKEDEAKIRKLTDFEEKLTVNTFGRNSKQRNEWERHLMHHNHKKAFALVFAEGDLSNIYSVMKYLYEKRQLKSLLVDQKESFVMEFTGFIVDYFYISDLQPILIECMVILASLYARLLKTKAFDELLELFGNVLEDEIEFGELKIRTVSFLESFMQ